MHNMHHSRLFPFCMWQFSIPRQWLDPFSHYTVLYWYINAQYPAQTQCRNLNNPTSNYSQYFVHVYYSDILYYWHMSNFHVLSLLFHVNFVWFVCILRNANLTAHLIFSSRQMSVYVGSPTSVVQLPLFTCKKYSSCFECVMARDPFCAWNGLECVEISSHNIRYKRVWSWILEASVVLLWLTLYLNVSRLSMCSRARSLSLFMFCLRVWIYTVEFFSKL